MTNDALERELSRVLHELPGEPAAHPGRLHEVQGRARRIRAQRYAAVAATVATVVALVIAVPLSLRGGQGGSNHPVPTSDPSTWPTRGALAGDAALRTRAIAAWQRALTAAHRGQLTHPIHEVYADHVRGAGIVVVLSGIEPRGSDRTVIAAGPDANHLGIYVDGNAAPSAISVLFGPRIQTASGGCPITNKASSRWTLFILGPPGTTSARWQLQGATPPTCRGTNTGPWHDIALTNGAGSSTLTDPAVNLYVEGGGTSLDASGVGGRSPVDRLGGRVASAARLGELTRSQTTYSTGPNSASVGGTTGRDTGNPLGWRQRTDASSPIDILYVDTGAAFGDGASSFAPELSLALPDGALTMITVGLGPSGPERLFLIAAADTSRNVRTYINRPLDSRHLPVEISAIVNGRDGHRWLFVAGEPGVASIDYRPAGAAQWRSLDVYQSTAFARVGAGDRSGDRIRLRLADGTVVYQGRVDALGPIAAR